ncbi:MAG: aldo/keto reductase [Chitinivibrionales bacterium]
MNRIELKSGNSIPQIGLGTWKLTGDTCRDMVKEALLMGYRHIDTADAYGNHEEVGAGMDESRIPRDSFFLTTKIQKESLHYNEVIKGAETMLKQLRTEYIDLLLIHWPNKKVPFEETFKGLSDLRGKGVVKDIGISNFNKDITADAVDVSEAPVVMNQVEFHPFLYQEGLLNACTDLGVKVTAYSPLAQGRVFKNETLSGIAEKHGVSESQVSLAWLFSKGIIAVPKASSVDHLRDNFGSVELQLPEEDIRLIDTIHEGYRVVDGPWKDYEF